MASTLRFSSHRLAFALIATALLPRTVAFAAPPDPSPPASLSVSHLSLHPEVAARLLRVERSMIFFPRAQLGAEHGAAFVDSSVDRNHLLYIQGRGAHYGGETTPGVALFAALTILSARAPEPLRQLFVGNPHLGAAMLTDGAIGAAARLRF